MTLRLFLFCKYFILLFIYFFFFFLIPHLSDVIWYLPFSVWLHLVWQSLGPSMWLQMTLFHSSLWLGSITHYYAQYYGWVIYMHCICVWGSPAGTVVKNPPANAGDVSSIPGSRRSLAWKIPWSLVGSRPQGHKESDTTKHTHKHTHITSSLSIHLLMDT